MLHSIKPEGAPWVSPYILVSDVDHAVQFYQQAFGFEKHHIIAGKDNLSWHAEMRYHNQLLMFGKAEPQQTHAQPPAKTGLEIPINLYLYCEDVDAFYERAIKSGAISLVKPEDTFWEDRMCRLQDPDGYIWCFATYLGKN